MKMPPRRMKLHEVPNYVDLRLGNPVTRMTVYNWTNKGVKGVKLKFVLGKAKPNSAYAGVRLTTSEWVDEFLTNMQAALRGG